MDRLLLHVMVMKTKKANPTFETFRLVTATALICTFAWGCSSAKPKKDEHALANILLGHPPAIGVPEDGAMGGMTDDRVSGLTPTVSDETLAADRDMDRRRDQDSYEMMMSTFRQRFNDIKSEEERAENGPSVLRQQRLEQAASTIQMLRSELARYGQNPGNLFFYNEGEEKLAVLKSRSDEISQLDHDWADHLADLEERVSSIRAADALQRLHESVNPESRETPGAAKALR